MKILILSTIICLFAVNGFAAVKTWDGGGADNNWATAANWVGDVAPAAADDLVFPVAAAQFSTNNNSGLLTVYRSVTIEGGNYTIGGNPLSLTNGLTVNAGTQTISTIVNLGAAQTFVAGENSITVLAVLSVGNFPLAFNGQGAFVVGVITGAGNITKNGLGAVLLAAANNYRGALFINGGALIVDAIIPNSPVTVNATGTVEGLPFGSSGLGGTGTVGATNVTAGVISAGTVDSATGILNISNGLTISAEGIYLNKIGGTNPGADGYDQLNVVGAVNLNNARLEVLPLSSLDLGDFSPAVGDTFIILKNDGTDPINGTFLNAPEGARFNTALNIPYRITYRGGDGNDVAITRVSRSNFDFDGDGKADVSVFRPSEGAWYIQGSQSGFIGNRFGISTDKIVPADYDGDGKTDIAVYRPSEGAWYILNSRTGAFTGVRFGSSGDIPAPADYDGDGRAEIAVYRPSEGNWYMFNLTNNSVTGARFGLSGDIPVAADYDGDGRADIALFRPSEGNWYIQRSRDGFFGARWGISTDKPVVGDYDGDGKSDLAVFRPAEGSWYVQQSRDGFLGVRFGVSTDLPVAADYDGDGKTDIAVFRPSGGDWYLLKSRDGLGTMHFGSSSDKPAPNAFVP